MNILCYLLPFLLIPTFYAEASESIKVHNIEYPSRLYGNNAAIVTVESSSKKVECVAYKGGIPVGSGSGYTIANIANVSILMSERSGDLTVKCN